MANEQTKSERKQSANPFLKMLTPHPVRPGYEGSGKLNGKIAVVTGGDSGIGRSVAAYFAREGADVVIIYDLSDEDAAEAKGFVEAEGRRCLLIKGDLKKEAFCKSAAARIQKEFGRVDVLVNNAGVHTEQEKLEDISAAQLKDTFETNVYPMYLLTRELLGAMPEGAAIVNTASVTAYRGSGHLLDYAATKGAIVSFTRSLSSNLADRGIRVNGVAPGPVWTPLVVEAFDSERLKKFGKDTPMKRAGFPYEVGPAYVFLASADSSYITGQVIHVNGGEVVNG